MIGWADASEGAGDNGALDASRPPPGAGAGQLGRDAIMLAKTLGEGEGAMPMGTKKKRKAGGFGNGAALDYSLRALCYLADGRVASSLDISEARDVPRDYLVQLMQDLREAGLVRGRPGRLGGYGLARAASDVSVAEVVDALAGSGSDPGAGAEAAAVVALVRERLASIKLSDLSGDGGRDLQRDL